MRKDTLSEQHLVMYEDDSKIIYETTEYLSNCEDVVTKYKPIDEVSRVIINNNLIRIKYFNIYFKTK